MYEYMHFTCRSDQLEALLNRHGRDNWRLHTCEPMMAADDTGDVVLSSFVVMDKIVANEDEHAATEPEGEPAMGMKG